MMQERGTMTGFLTLAQLASRLGVSPGTVDDWIAHLDLDIPRGPAGELQVPEDAMPLFETVRTLRSRDRSYGTIQRVIGPHRSGHSDSTDGIFSPEQILAAMERVNQLAQDYAKATYRIGQLEERIRHLEEQLNHERLAHRQTLEQSRQRKR
jgi:hypothetical protein